MIPMRTTAMETVLKMPCLNSFFTNFYTSEEDRGRTAWGKTNSVKAREYTKMPRLFSRSRELVGHK